MNNIDKILRPFSENEGSIFTELRTEISLFDLSNIAPDRIEFLNRSRVLSSNTLSNNRSIEELERWDRANKKINDFIVIGDGISFEKIIEINSIFTQEDNLRDFEIYSGDEMYLPISEVNTTIQKFKSYLVENTDSPLELAFKVSQWIITIHPFINGNGRTARLISDWILIRSGYLPICYRSSVSSHIGFTSNNYEIREVKINRFKEGLLRSYRLLVE